LSAQLHEGLSPIDSGARRRRVRRSATVLGLVALAFYLGFIAMAVFKAVH